MKCQNLLLAVVGVAILSSAAFGTELIGSYSNSSSADLNGYTADGSGGTGPTYDVPANAGATPSATFDDNGFDGLFVNGSGISATVEGGEFDGNFETGIEAAYGAAITISGGKFDNNDEGYASVYGTGSSVTITGGEFLNNGYAMDVDGGGKAVVSGGQFGNSEIADFIVIDQTVDTFSPSGTLLSSTVVPSTMDLYGAFAGLTTGQTEVLSNEGVPATGSLAPDAFDRTFYGQLEYATAPQTFTYLPAGGTITLHATSDLVPEPATASLFSLAILSLLKRRR